MGGLAAAGLPSQGDHPATRTRRTSPCSHDPPRSGRADPAPAPCRRPACRCRLELGGLLALRRSPTRARAGAAGGRDRRAAGPPRARAREPAIARGRTPAHDARPLDAPRHARVAPHPRAGARAIDALAAIEPAGRAGSDVRGDGAVAGDPRATLGQHRAARPRRSERHGRSPGAASRPDEEARVDRQGDRPS